MNLKSLKEKYISSIYKEKAFLIKEEYTNLHHGGKSHLFLNHSQFLSKFKNLETLSNLYTHLLPKNIKNFKIGVVDSVMSPILGAMIAHKLKKDIVVIKENKLEHGLENKIYGDASGEVILVDDVTSTGTILINAANALRGKGGKVRYALISACRDLSAIENLEKNNIKAFYVARYEEIISSLWPKLGQKEKEAVRLEVKEKGYKWKIK